MCQHLRPDWLAHQRGIRVHVLHQQRRMRVIEALHCGSHHHKVALSRFCPSERTRALPPAASSFHVGASMPTSITQRQSGFGQRTFATPLPANCSRGTATGVLHRMQENLTSRGSGRGGRQFISTPQPGLGQVTRTTRLPASAARGTLMGVWQARHVNRHASSAGGTDFAGAGFGTATGAAPRAAIGAGAAVAAAGATG